MQSCYVNLEKSGRNLECKFGEGSFDRMLRICGISRRSLCRNGSIRKKEGGAVPAWLTSSNINYLKSKNNI